MVQRKLNKMSSETTPFDSRSSRSVAADSGATCLAVEQQTGTGNSADAGHPTEKESAPPAALESLAVEPQDMDDPYCVNFDHNDPRDPRNFSAWRKWQILGVTLLLEGWVNVISSIYSFGAHDMAEEFGIGAIPSRLPAAVYLFGFAVGPILAAPLSEDFGRYPVMVVGMVVVGLAQIACALAPNLAVLIIFRFIAGLFGAVGFNAIGTVSDLWGPDDQGWGVNLFALMAEAGATLGPVIGGFTVQDAGWRWTFGVSGIVLAFLLAIFIVTVPETRGGVILARRAKKLRKQEQEPKYFAMHERIRSEHTVSALAKEMVGRPLLMLFTEPIVFWFALFDGVNYAVIYIFLEAYPLIFVQYGFTMGQQGLTFIGVLIGFLIAFGLFAFQIKWHRQAGSKRPGGIPTPEDRLLWGIPGGLLFPVSLFFFAWTSFPPVPWIVPVIAGASFGISSHILFLIVSDYVVSSYSIYAASAVAAQSFLREFLSGSFTIVTETMYERLGYQWASSLLAFVGIPLSIIPLIFFRYGPIIRKRSSFAQELDKVEREQKAFRERQETKANNPAPQPPISQHSAQQNEKSPA